MLGNKDSVVSRSSSGMFLALTVFLIAFTIQINTQKEELEEEQNKLVDELANLREGNEATVELLNEFHVELHEVKQEKKKLEEENKKLNNEIEKKQKQIKEKDSEIKRLKKPVTKVSNESVGGNNKTSGRVLSMNATHYSAFCPTGCTGKTATGVDVSNTIYHNGKRVVAVDPNVIPLGSTVRVTGGGYDFEAVAIDTGGDIKGNRIDILVESTEKAYELGRKDVQVRIIN